MSSLQSLANQERPTFQIDPNVIPVLLKPFTVDSQNLAAQLPSAIEFGQQYNEIDDHLGFGVQKLHEVADRRISRRQFSQQDIEALYDLTASGAALVEPITDETDRKTAVEQLFKPFMVKTELEKLALSQIQLNINQIILGRELATDYSKLLVKELVVGLDQGSITRYDILKLIAGVPNKGQDAATESCLKDSTAYLLTHAEFSQGSTILSDLRHDLSEGAYDRAVAFDILCHVQKGHQNDSPHLKRLSDLRSFARDVNPDSDDKTLNRQIVQSSNWSSEALTAVRDIRTALLQRFERTIEQTRILIDDDGVLEKVEPSIEAFNGHIKKLAISLMEQYGTQRLPTVFGFSQIDVLRERVSRKRARPVVDSCANEEQAPTLEIQPDPRPLVFVDAGGQEYPRDSDKFKRMVEEYLSDYRGNQALRDDVNTILDHMSAFDFRKKIQGAQMYAGSIKRGDTSMDIWGFKPAFANALPKTSPQARKIRVLFSVVDDKLAIHYICDRDKVTQIEKNLKLRK